MKIFVDLNAQGQTIIIVTHEKDIAEYARRQVHLHDGLIDKDFLNNEGRS
jgi:putative ABC transport system ATP-binding protein